MKEPFLIVIGGGIGGGAAALRAAQYLIPTAWILGDRDTRRASRSSYVRNIDNMLGVHPGIVQNQLAEILREEHPKAAQAAASAHLHVSTMDLVENAAHRIRAEFGSYVKFVEERATELTRTHDGFRAAVASGDHYEAPHAILATGVMDRQPVIHKERGGRDLSGVHWVYPYANQETLLYCIRCEGHLTIDRRAGVIGAGPSAAEVALMIRERYGSEVVVMTAGDAITWSEEQARFLELHGVRVVEGRLVDLYGGARGAQLRGFSIEGGERVEVDLAFVAMGLHRVYNELARKAGAELYDEDAPLDQRHVRVGAAGETSIPGLFAVGDMARRPDEPIMKQVYTAQEYAVRAVDTIDRRRRQAIRQQLLAEGTVG